MNDDADQPRSDETGAPAASPLRAPSRASVEEPDWDEREKGSGVGLVFRLIGGAFALGAVLAVAAVIAAFVYISSLSEDLPSIDVLGEYEPEVTTRVHAGDGSLIAEYAAERRIFVPIEAIPVVVRNAFIAAEDKSFYTHAGIDPRGIVRAAISNIDNYRKGRRLEGASTITQQVAKNFLLSSEQRYERKIKEQLLALKIERTFTKDEILELYLNEIYLGNGSYGVAAAALNYFNKPLAELTAPEAAYLAAVAKGPSNYHPIRRAERAVARRNWVLGRMFEEGFLTDGELAAARATELGAAVAPPLGARQPETAYFTEQVRQKAYDVFGEEGLYDGGLSIRTTLDPRLQKLARKALRDGLEAYDRRHGWRGPVARIQWADGLADVDDAGADEPAWLAPLGDVPYISDLAPWRLAAVLEFGETAATIGLRDGSTASIPLEEILWAREFLSVNTLGEEIETPADVFEVGDVVYVQQIDGATYGLRQAPAVNGGVIAIDPHTGRVLAMEGGFSFQMSEFNRAVQAERQPGSAFKPFVYAAALDLGYTPSSIVLDAPFVAPGGRADDLWYKPTNYTGYFNGESTLRYGIEQSKNMMTVRLAQEIGMGPIISNARRFGIAEGWDPVLAVSLGAGETTLIKLTAAYAMLVNGGKYVTPIMIDQVQNRYGKAVFSSDARSCAGCDVVEWRGQSRPRLADTREQVIDPRTAYQIVSMMEGVVERGTAKSSVGAKVSQTVAGKTGTTNDYIDAWFVGFSPDLVAGVYVGYDLPSSLGSGESGGGVAAPIFADFMAGALGDSAGVPFRVPQGLRFVRVNFKTGLPAKPGEGNVVVEAFKATDLAGDGVNALAGLGAPAGARDGAEGEDEDDDLGGLY
ncbi:MAG: penicillin-binding protein 1A [Pseudomonadota bacterium]